MIRDRRPTLPLESIVRIPRRARAGQTYLMTVDVRHHAAPEEWPYDQEEYPLTCLLDTMPLFEHTPLGEPTLIVHRFGGTYGEVRFLLKAAEGELQGNIRLTLVTKAGMAATVQEFKDIWIETESTSITIPDDYDLFISHATSDKPWVRTLTRELESLGLRAYLDESEIRPATNYVLSLDAGLGRSRFLVLVLTPRALARKWVEKEWTSFIARNGPLGRVLPVMLETVQPPALLASIQYLNALDQDARRVAAELAAIVGRPDDLAQNDTRRLLLGQHLVFTLALKDDGLAVTAPDGTTREVTLPWRDAENAARFTAARLGFRQRTQEPITTGAEHVELVRHATTLGDYLFGMLFDEDAIRHLEHATLPGYPRPLITLRSADDVLLSLPWELLHHDDSFLLRDGRVDLARSTPDDIGPGALVPEPPEIFKLVVNVSAPAGSGLDHESESYRITRALTESVELTPTELGTVEDLIATTKRVRPAGLHFSGHGAPGRLQFEDDEGRSHDVDIAELAGKLKDHLPPFFYLASCHGNEPVVPEKDHPGSESSAAHLHRAGVAQVVGYYGPIADELSTRAEEALYGALAAGETARYAVREAREALQRPFRGRAGHRETATTEAPVATSYPFAWAQLVLYHRGPDRSLCKAVPAAVRRSYEALPERTFQGLGKRLILQTGFVGRRTELHQVRQRIRRGDKVFVFQGLGGLGKSTLAFRVLPMLGAEEEVVVLWCQETESHPDRAEALVAQLLDYCRMRFGAGWEQVVFQVDRAAGDDSARRFVLFLDVLLQNVPSLVLYLDNLESLQVGLDDPRSGHDENAMGEWRSPAVAAIWRALAELAGQRELRVVASCRYRHPDFSGQLLPVSPMAPDALYRMMGWFPALRRLTGEARAVLVGRLAGHPRAVEFANDLVAHRLGVWEDERGPWALSDPPTEEELERERRELLEPALPKVRERLWDDLLLAAIWERVLDERARRMLFRMTLLRVPWEPELNQVLGEPDEPEEQALETTERLRRTSLLEQVELWRRATAEGKPERVRHYTLHPATVQFIVERFGEHGELARAAHLRVGEVLEAQARSSPYIETYIEAGHHLLAGGEPDRAFGLLGSASQWLQERGRVREGLGILEPFLAEPVLRALKPELAGQLLGTVGTGHYRLGEVEKAIGYYEQALVIAREIGDWRGEGSVLGNLGLAYADLGEVEKAIGYYEQDLVIAREIGDRSGEGSVLGNLGTAYARLGEVEKAIGYCEQALVIAREIGDRRGEGNQLGNLGLAYAALGEVGKAIGYHEQALVISREIGDRSGEGQDLGNLGNAYFVLGEVEKAIGYYEQALVIAREIGDRRGEGNDLGNLGIAYARLGEVEKAIGYYDQILLIHREIGDRSGEGNTLGNLGVAYARLGEVEKAIGLLEQALRIGQEIKDPQIVRNTSAVLEELRGSSTS